MKKMLTVKEKDINFIVKDRYEATGAREDVTMAIIRGKVDPDQAGAIPGQRFFNLGQWNMKCVVRDFNGNKRYEKRFVANTDGTFEVEVEIVKPSVVEVVCLGGWAYKDDSVTVEVFGNDEVIHCPRHLKME